MYIFETSQITIKGLSCKLFVSITPPLGNKQGHTISATISLLGLPEVLLASTMEFDAMLIPEGSIEDELDKQVALGSAEALLDIDSLQNKAGQVVNRLASLFADQYFGLPDRPISGV
jgi:hypothetical protein